MSDIKEPQEAEKPVLGKKNFDDTIALQLVNAAYEILKVGGCLSPEKISEMTVKDLLDTITPNKLRLRLEKI